LGYAIFDVEGEIPEAAAEDIRDNSATRRVRVING